MPYDINEKRVVVAVREWERYKAFGFSGPVCYCVAIERDAQGLWIENTEWPLAPAGPDGADLRTVHFLIPWTEIISVGFFPKQKNMAGLGVVVNAASAKP